jgi:hypothetical protein
LDFFIEVQRQYHVNLLKRSSAGQFSKAMPQARQRKSKRGILARGAMISQ